MHLGVPEVLIILVIAVVIFGPSRLAGLGKGLGDGIRDFKAAVHSDPEKETPAAPQPRE